MQRIVESLADLGVGIDDDQWVDALGADDDVVEVLGVEDVQVLLQLGDHDGQKMAVAVLGEEPAQFRGALLLVLALDDRALVNADTDGDLPRLAGLDDVTNLRAVGDVAGVEADLVDAGLDSLQCPLEMEVYIGHDGDGHTRKDFLEGGRVLAFRDGHADDLGAGGGQFVDFGHAGVDVVGIASGHGLNGDGRIAADGDDSVQLVAHKDLARFSACRHSGSKAGPKFPGRS